MSTSHLIIKADRKKQLVYAEAYRPRAVDTDKEYQDFEDVEYTAHQFMLEGRTDKIDLNHNFQESGCKVVESFIARKGDPDFTPGSWVLGVKVFDDGLWDRIEKGEFNGFSWGTRIDPVRETALAYKSSPIKGEGLTEPCGAGLLPEHSHPVTIKFDGNSKVVRTHTGEALGHTHEIRKTTATQMNLDHAHRLDFVAKAGKSDDSLTLKFNEHHDAAGRFASADHSGSSSHIDHASVARAVASQAIQTPAAQAAWDHSRDSVVKLADVAGPKLDSFTQTAHNANTFVAPVSGALWAASASTALIPAVGPEIAAALAAAASTARATTLALEVLEESSKHASVLLTDLKKHAEDPKSTPDEIKSAAQNYMVKHADVALKMAQIFGPTT